MYDEDLIQTLCAAKKPKLPMQTLKDSALADKKHEVATASQDPGQAGSASANCLDLPQEIRN